MREFACASVLLMVLVERLCSMLFLGFLGVHGGCVTRRVSATLRLVCAITFSCSIATCFGTLRLAGPTTTCSLLLPRSLLWTGLCLRRAWLRLRLACPLTRPPSAGTPLRPWTRTPALLALRVRRCCLGLLPGQLGLPAALARGRRAGSVRVAHTLPVRRLHLRLLRQRV